LKVDSFKEVSRMNRFAIFVLLVAGIMSNGKTVYGNCGTCPQGGNSESSSQTTGSEEQTSEAVHNAVDALVKDTFKDNETTILDPNGDKTTTYTDGDTSTTVKTDKDGNIITWVSTKTDPEGGSFTEWSDGDTSRIYPDGSKVDYDKEKNTTTMRNPDGTWTKTHENVDGSTTTTFSDGSSVGYGTNNDGRPTKTTDDGKGNVQTYTGVKLSDGTVFWGTPDTPS
jgi:hypothetical protein